MNRRVKTRQETRNRHKRMVCKSYLLKIDRSHLSKRIRNRLNLLFLEAKWFINHAIANGVFDTDYKTTTVRVKEGLNRLPVERREAALSNQGRQACGEESSTLAMLEYLNGIPHVRARLLVEAGSLTALA